jgi:hypothetical protein
VNVLNSITHIGLSQPKNGVQERYPNLARWLIVRDTNIIVLEAAEFVARPDASLSTIYSYSDLKFVGRKLHLFRDFALRPRTVNSNVAFLRGGTGAPIFERENVRSVGAIGDLLRSFAAGDLATVSLRAGTGTWVKIFQYLNKGLPTVTTQKGLEGVFAPNGKQGLIAPRVEEQFVDKVVALLKNKSQRARLGANVRRLLDAKHTLYAIGAPLSVGHERVLGGRYAS